MATLRRSVLTTNSLLEQFGELRHHFRIETVQRFWMDPQVQFIWRAAFCPHGDAVVEIAGFIFYGDERSLYSVLGKEEATVLHSLAYEAREQYLKNNQVYFHRDGLLRKLIERIVRCDERFDGIAPELATNIAAYLESDESSVDLEEVEEGVNTGEDHKEAFCMAFLFHLAELVDHPILKSWRRDLDVRDTSPSEPEGTVARSAQ